MKGKNITITSKNQITIPAEYVRSLKLAKHRQLSIRRRGDELVLKPEPTLEEDLQELWATLPPFKGTRSDKELKHAIREVFTRKKV